MYQKDRSSWGEILVLLNTTITSHTLSLTELLSRLSKVYQTESWKHVNLQSKFNPLNSFSLKPEPSLCASK